MRQGATIVLSGGMHQSLHTHLFPGDGKEAAAILLCSRVGNGRIKLMVNEIVTVPHDTCERYPDYLCWPGNFIEHALDKAERDDLSLILVHSHPGNLFEYSPADIASDDEVIPAVFMGRAAHHQGKLWHGSAIMVPSGAMRARIYDENHTATPVELVAVYGDDLHFYWNPDLFPSLKIQRPMAFSHAMTNELGYLSACIIGVSGTGSIIAEQAARMGFGEVILIDFDKIEKKNLNRILNAIVRHADNNDLKVNVAADAILSYRPGCIVKKIPTGIDCRQAILAACMADVVFSCVDSHEGRQICDLMASAFIQPLFDVGVTIPVRESENGEHALLDVVGRIDYVQPGGSTLACRNVFTPATLAAEYLEKADPEAYRERVNEGYMPGTHEEAPSVISLNMRAASTCVNEFLARAYPFRLDPNCLRARTLFSLAACEDEYIPEAAFPKKPSPILGAGLRKPLLGLPYLED